MTAGTEAAATTAAADRAGIYDIPASVYHADKTSLSSTGARKLLPPSCPAKFRYEQDHPPARKKELDFGAAVHAYLFGGGPQLIIVKEVDWRSPAARAERERATISGDIALLLPDLKQVEAMAAALREHPVAKLLFAPGSGQPEKSLYWVDPPTGVTRRARPDWLPNHTGGRLIIPDYKTTRDASPAAIERALFEYGYFQQAAWYIDGARTLVADDVAFVLVFQEKTPPYLVHVVEPAAVAVKLGRELNRRALELFAECTATGRWPGYSDDVTPVSLPVWAENKLMQELV